MWNDDIFATLWVSWNIQRQEPSNKEPVTFRYNIDHCLGILLKLQENNLFWYIELYNVFDIRKNKFLWSKEKLQDVFLKEIKDKEYVIYCLN